jgi:hypothetical protein
VTSQLEPLNVAGHLVSPCGVVPGRTMHSRHRQCDFGGTLTSISPADFAAVGDTFVMTFARTGQFVQVPILRGLLFNVSTTPAMSQSWWLRCAARSKLPRPVRSLAGSKNPELRSSGV